MRPLQGRFWPDPQPLVERLGIHFFRQVPETPGVYLMRGQADVLLYVGKARNLRRRLGSYRVANPERMPRRTLRLLSLVEQIAWEQCDDEATALRREAELLRSLKPCFNRAGVWQGPARYVAWRASAAGLHLAVLASPESGWHCSGPFGAQAREMHRALVRLLWCRFRPDAGLAGMPTGWFHGAHGSSTLIPHSNETRVHEACAQLVQLATTGDDDFARELPPVAVPFEEPLRASDLELVITRLSGRALVAHALEGPEEGTESWRARDGVR